MPSSYTTSLRLTLPATGELSGQWGTTVNTGITELVDSAVAGTTTISTWGGPGVPYTLSNNSGTADEARRMFIVATGTPGEAKNVICPAVSKFYVFRNDTTGGFALTLKTSGGTGIAVPAGQYKFLYCDGTNVVDAFNSAGALTLSGALSVGGTSTLSALTASTALALNASKEVVSVTNTGSGNNVLATSPTLVTPVLGAATATSVNGLTVSSTTGTLSLANGSTLATSGANSLTMTTTGATNVTFPTSGTLATTGGTVASFSAGSTGFTPSTATTGAVTLAGTLATTNGGTGLTSFTSGGVVYASSTSALTTGSALTFDGTNFATTGSGTLKNLLLTGGTLPAAGNPSVALRSADNVIYHQAGSANNIVFLDSAQNTMYSFTPTSHIWNISNTEQMRLTSTGLGIGTSSPGQKLSVNGDALIGTNLFISNGAGSMVGATSPSLYSPASGTLGISTAGVERMRLDSSGNLGLGVTPSAWSGKAVEVGANGTAIWNLNQTNTSFTCNAYYDGAYKYGGNGLASSYQQASGIHYWYTAPSGTAGNAISFTQAMTLDASGNLVLGTTAVAAAEGYRFYKNYGRYDNGTFTGFIGAGNSLGAGSTDFAFRSENALAFLAGGATERARISSTGSFTVNAATSIAAGTNTLQDSGSSPQTVRLYNNTDSNNTTNRFLICDAAASVLRAEIRSNGGLANYSANNVNLSDRREKTNFAPAKSYLDTICAIPVQTFSYIDQSEDDPGLTLGVVAQDVQAVAPELVMESNWGTAEEPKQRLSIYQTDLQYALMKCVQELKAELDSVKAELATLKGKP